MKNAHKRVLALCLGVALIGTGLVGCSSDDKKDTSSTSNNQQTEQKQDNSANTAKDSSNGQNAQNAQDANVKDMKIGQTVNINKDLQFTVNSVGGEEQTTVDDKKAEEGMKFVVVNWTAKNTSQQDQAFDTLVSTLQVKDRQGKIFTKHNAEIVGQNNGNVIPAGAEVQGTYVIQAPKDKNLADLLLLVNGGENTTYAFSLVQ